MTTEAEEAAGRELREKSFPMQPFSVKWEDLKPEIRSEWVRDAMDIVRAYQRAAWREPTAKDMRERKPLLCTNSYMRAQDVWSPWRRPTITEWFQPSDQFDTVRVQDLPPLPELKL